MKIQTILSSKFEQDLSNTVDQRENINTNIELTVADDYDYSILENNQIDLTYFRKFTEKSSGASFITCSARVLIDCSDTPLDERGLRRPEAYRLFVNIATELSLIIANNTAAFSRVPLITPPNVISKNNEKFQFTQE